MDVKVVAQKGCRLGQMQQLSNRSYFTPLGITLGCHYVFL